MVAYNCAVDFQRVTFAADISQRFEEPKPVANVYRELCCLFECLEKFVVGSKFELRVIFGTRTRRGAAGVASSSNSVIGVRVNRTRMTRKERIDADLFWLYPR